MRDDLPPYVQGWALRPVNVEVRKFHPHNFNRLAAESIREKVSAHASKATFLADAFGVDRGLESDWPTMAIRVSAADFEQPTAQSDTYKAHRIAAITDAAGRPSS